MTSDHPASTRRPAARGRVPLTALLLIACVTLALLIGWLWTQRPIPTEVVDVEPVTPALDSPVAVRVPAPPASSAITDRPLLWIEREPYAEPAAPASSGPDPFADVSVLGVIDSASGSGVLLRTPSGVQRVALGDRFAGWILASIHADAVEFLSPDQRIHRLALKRPRIENGELRID